MNLKLPRQLEFLGLNASKEGPDEVLRIFVVQAVLTILMSDPSSDMQKVFPRVNVLTF